MTQAPNGGVGMGYLPPPPTGIALRFDAATHVEGSNAKNIWDWVVCHLPIGKIVFITFDKPIPSGKLTVSPTQGRQSVANFNGKSMVLRFDGDLSNTLVDIQLTPNEDYFAAQSVGLAAHGVGATIEHSTVVMSGGGTGAIATGDNALISNVTVRMGKEKD